jgi:hypothetical protein
MNENKLKRLFDSARKETAPAVPPDFAAGVLRAVRREPGPRAVAPFSIFDQLNYLFPRLALAAVVVILLCALGNLLLPGADAEMVSADQNLSLEDL